MHDQYARGTPPTAVPAFADLGAWAVWNADTLAATAVNHLGERAFRTRKPNRRPGVPALALLGLAGYLAARKAARS